MTPLQIQLKDLAELSETVKEVVTLARKIEITIEKMTVKITLK